MQDENEKQNLLTRLKKIEGQVKGIQKMIDNEKECIDILIQIAAVRSAINKVGGILIENHAKKCVIKASKENDEDALNELMEVFSKFMK